MPISIPQRFQHNETGEHVVVVGVQFQGESSSAPLQSMPRAKFAASFSIAARVPYAPRMVTGEWLPDSVAVLAYCDGQAWNGWLMPLFPIESGLALAEQMPGLQYDAAGDAFVLCDSESDYGPLRIESQEILCNGTRLKVYGIGDGFCWEASPL